MALKIGPTEAERYQVIDALRSGQSFSEATAELRKMVEADWFERNEEHLHDVAAHGEAKPSLAALATDQAEPSATEPGEPDAGKARKGKARKGKARKGKE